MKRKVVWGEQRDTIFKLLFYSRVQTCRVLLHMRDWSERTSIPWALYWWTIEDSEWSVRQSSPVSCSGNFFCYEGGRLLSVSFPPSSSLFSPTV